MAPPASREAALGRPPGTAAECLAVLAGSGWVVSTGGGVVGGATAVGTSLCMGASWVGGCALTAWGVGVGATAAGVSGGGEPLCMTAMAPPAIARTATPATMPTIPLRDDPGTGPG